MLPTATRDHSTSSLEPFYDLRHHEARWKREERLRAATRRREERPHRYDGRRASRRWTWEDNN